MKKWLGMAVLVVGLLLCGAFASSRHPENNDSRSETTQGTEMGSTEAIESKTTAEIETQSQEETEAEDISDVLTGPLTHYIPGMDQSTKENIPQVISSMEEFRAYCEKEETFVSKEEFKAIVDRFDQEFWENYDLLMVNWYEGNTGSRSYIVSLTKGNESSEADWIIAKYIKQEKAGNAVFTPWQSITEIPKGMIKEDETFSFEYYGNPINVAYDIESIRTDMWKPADGGKLWDISETPLYLMDTRDQLEDYCKAHPELQGEFLEICARYDA